VIFISEYSRDVGLGLGVPVDRAVVDCPGIALEDYGPAHPKEDVVFFTGKLEIRKGIYDLLDVALALPHVRFRIMGWGPEEVKIRGMAPPNVEFVPFERGEPLRKQFAAARIFFFPTHAETFGIALVEAMASGCAVISSIPLKFEGIKIAPGDRQAMIRAVDALWADHEETARMGHRNMDLAQPYTWDRFTTTLLNVYSDVLNGSGSWPADAVAKPNTTAK
jgi:glycosyltransferase involved in cell wall biosynthesis